MTFCLAVYFVCGSMTWPHMQNTEKFMLFETRPNNISKDAGINPWIASIPQCNIADPGDAWNRMKISNLSCLCPSKVIHNAVPWKPQRTDWWMEADGIKGNLLYWYLSLYRWQICCFHVCTSGKIHYTALFHHINSPFMYAEPETKWAIRLCWHY